jgi:hypothetical protein
VSGGEQPAGGILDSLGLTAGIDEGELVSITIVTNDGREYYGTIKYCDLAALHTNPRLMANVALTPPPARSTGPDGDFLARAGTLRVVEVVDMSDTTSHRTDGA